MGHDIFLSYSRKDTTMMRQVKQSFNSEGLNTWTDEGIEPGTPSWREALDNAIKECKALVCITSPDSKRSKWVQAELGRAEFYGKNIFLILVRGDIAEAIPFGYEFHQWTDIRDEKDYENGIEKLIAHLKNIIGFNSQIIQKSKPTQTPIDKFIVPITQEYFIPSVGDVVDGKIEEINTHYLFVDIGAPLPGYIPISELQTLEAMLDKKIMIGTELPVFITKFSESDFDIELSALKGIKTRNWEQIHKLEERGTLTYVIIKDFEDGNALVQWKSLTGIIPSGHFTSIIDVADLNDLIGQKLMVQVWDCDQKQSRIIFSQVDTNSD